MKPWKVFIASSSEGLDVAKTVRALLLDGLGDLAEPRSWTRSFELSATYIESLEKACDEADFAVIIVTPDDLTVSREKKKASARDNVVFELGLFMGALGRERCFVVVEQTADIKLPSDLLGVGTAGFRRLPDRSLAASLDACCLAIAERIRDLKGRYRLSREVVALQSGIRKFCESLEGAWWERMVNHEACVLSFFWIEYETLFSSVSLAGKSYDRDGAHSANWKSAIARVEHDKHHLLYHWAGSFTLAERAQFMFHGFGEMTFDKPSNIGDAPSHGTGRFWDVDEGHPSKTTIWTSQLRRVPDRTIISTMTEGNEKAVRSLIKKTLLRW